jgi:DNA-directed RNA polymerase subunit RPC12/RpoP
VVEPPRMTKGRRPGRPDRRPKNAPASADESPSGLSSALSVTRDDGKRRSRRGRYPQANASLYEPACQRTWWWISLRCPWCGSVHLHRVRREQDAGGVRRTGCGRRVFVKVRTVYRGKANVRIAA